MYIIVVLYVISGCFRRFYVKLILAWLLIYVNMYKHRIIHKIFSHRIQYFRCPIVCFAQKNIVLQNLMNF